MALVDTGSTLTVVSTEIANKLNLKLARNSALRINQVQGNARSLGRAKVKLTIGSQTNEIDVHAIEGFNHDLLIGMDTAKIFRMKINTETRQISIKKPKQQQQTNMVETVKQQQLKSVINSFSDIFSKDETDIGRITDFVHTIRTSEHPPIQLRPYRRSVSEYEEINRQVKQMLKEGIIRESESPWAFPVRLVDKKILHRLSTPQFNHHR